MGTHPLCALVQEMNGGHSSIRQLLQEKRCKRVRSLNVHCNNIGDLEGDPFYVDAGGGGDPREEGQETRDTR